jgi:hypothetical protein
VRSDPDEIVRPETALERAICADPRRRAGVVWGDMRFSRADNETDGKTDEHRIWFAGMAT